MARPVSLEVFDRAHDGTVARSEVDEKVEKARFEGFESGYTSGWDDSHHALEEQRGQVSAEFARNLRDVSFTYHEARGHVLDALRPVLSEMTSKVLPRLALSGLTHTLCDLAMSFAAEEADAPVECAVAAANRPLLAELVAAQDSLPITVVVDSDLGEAEARLRSGARETHFDGDRLLSDMQAVVDAFFTIDREVETG